MDKFKQRMVEGAVRYAAGDKSDPFAFNRALAHIRSGLCGIDKDGRDAFYDATPAMETRCVPTMAHPEGEEYQVEVMRNMKRP